MTDQDRNARKAYLLARCRYENARMRYEGACSNERVETDERRRASAAAERRIYAYLMATELENLRKAEWTNPMGGR
jgi:hypothetical protein